MRMTSMKQVSGVRPGRQRYTSGWPTPAQGANAGNML